jgi:hypothetical protein
MSTRPHLGGAPALFLGVFLLPAAALAQVQPAPAAEVPPPLTPPPGLVPLATPPGGQPYSPPPGTGQPPPVSAPAWAPPPAPPSEEPPVKIDGVSASGLPLSQRGGILLETAALLFLQQQFIGSPSAGVSVAAIDLVARVPILPHTFLDADVPVGFTANNGGSAGVVGNLMVGAHHVFRSSDRLWFNLGGAFGFPLLKIANVENLALAKGFWDLEQFGEQLVPFAVRAGMESHAGAFEFRVEVDPVFGISIVGSSPFGGINGSDGHQLFALLHAVEIQAGHEIGGGLRYQGVLIATNNAGFGTASGSPGADRYQGVFEPFFRVYHGPVFFRLGLFLPVDTPLGPAFHKSWGVRLATGFNFD